MNVIVSVVVAVGKSAEQSQDPSLHLREMGKFSKVSKMPIFGSFA